MKLIYLSLAIATALGCSPSKEEQKEATKEALKELATEAKEGLDKEAAVKHAELKKEALAHEEKQKLLIQKLAEQDALFEKLMAATDEAEKAKVKAELKALKKELKVLRGDDEPANPKPSECDPADPLCGG